MSVLDKTRAAAFEADAATVADRDSSLLRCSCLPFRLWRGSKKSGRTESRDAEAAPPGQLHRRGPRRLRLVRLSCLASFSWPSWLRKSGKMDDAGRDDCTDKTAGKTKQQRRGGRRLLLLLKTSMQAKKALATVVVSGDSSALLPATVGSFGDAKKQKRSKPPRPASDGAVRNGTGEQPQQQQVCKTATGTSRARGKTTVPAGPPGNTNQPPCMTTADEAPAVASGGRIRRAPSSSRRQRSLHYHQPVRTGAGGLWTAATTLGMVVLFGRVTAVVLLCSCLYGVRFVRARAAKTGSGVVSGAASASRSRRFVVGDPIGVAAEKVKVAGSCVVTEESKKKVVIAGLLERDGKRSSSRF